MESILQWWTTLAFVFIRCWLFEMIILVTESKASHNTFLQQPDDIIIIWQEKLCNMSPHMSGTLNERRKKNQSISWSPLELCEGSPGARVVPLRPRHCLIFWWKYWPVYDQIMVTGVLNETAWVHHSYCTFSTPHPKNTQQDSCPKR